MFLWIFRSYKWFKKRVSYQGKTFQSLFLWIFRSYKWLENTSRSASVRFNPCSYGSFVLTKAARNAYTVTQRVSILVLMDLSFLRSKWLENTSRTDLFQSLFLWIFRSYTPVTDTDSLRTIESFNPCSYGSFVLTNVPADETIYRTLSFNPCSYGSFVLTLRIN